MKCYTVNVKYTVEGIVFVRAKNEEEARKKAEWEMTFPGTCDVTDMSTGDVKENVDE